MAYVRNQIAGVKLSSMSNAQITSNLEKYTQLARTAPTSEINSIRGDLRQENQARLAAALKDTGPGAGAARIEEARAQEEPKEPNVFLDGLPMEEFLRQREQAEGREEQPQEDVIQLGGTQEGAVTPTSVRQGTGGGSLEELQNVIDTIKKSQEVIAETTERLPGESDFEFQRRLSDEAARERELQYRAEDAAFFADIERRKREAELLQAEEDARFYRLIEISKRDREIMQRDEDDEFYVQQAREREEELARQREADKLYFEEIARLRREEELRQREADAAYWDEIWRQRQGGGGTTTPGTTTPTGTTRTFMPASSLGFGLLKSGGGFKTEEEEKKNE